MEIVAACLLLGRMQAVWIRLEFVCDLDVALHAFDMSQGECTTRYTAQFCNAASDGWIESVHVCCYSQHSMNEEES